MLILAFNSSPQDQQNSKTELVLQNFLEGARRAGALTETLYLRNYQINHCLGCASCWLETPGRCPQTDDMEQLFERYLSADLVVLATPVYFFSMNARMKMFIERTLPMSVPMLIDQKGRLHHTPRFQVPKVAVLSVCALPQADTFKALSLNMHMILGNLLVAEIYRHSSEALVLPSLAAKVQEVLAGVSRAGEELVQHGKVSPETLKAASQDLAPREEIIKIYNDFWQQKLHPSD